MYQNSINFSVVRFFRKNSLMKLCYWIEFWGTQNSRKFIWGLAEWDICVNGSSFMSNMNNEHIFRKRICDCYRIEKKREAFRWRACFHSSKTSYRSSCIIQMIFVNNLSKYLLSWHVIMKHRPHPLCIWSINLFSTIRIKISCEDSESHNMFTFVFGKTFSLFFFFFSMSWPFCGSRFDSKHFINVIFAFCFHIKM